MKPRPIIVSLWLASLVLAWAPAARAEQPLAVKAVGEYIARMERAYQSLHDYTAVLEQTLADQGQPRPTEIIFVKFQKPFRVYLKWIKEPHLGREVIYARDLHQGMVWVHRGDFPDITVCLRPATCQALSASRHGVDEVGLGFVIQLVKRTYQRALSRPQDQVRFVDQGPGQIRGRPVRCLESIMPAREDSGYYGHRARLCIDSRYHLPIKITIWDNENELYEEFLYTDLKLNPGLTEKDFDPKNPDYDF